MLACPSVRELEIHIAKLFKCAVDVTTFFTKSEASDENFAKRTKIIPALLTNIINIIIELGLWSLSLRE